MPRTSTLPSLFRVNTFSLPTQLDLSIHVRFRR
ncbi:hypothetical protein Lcho_4285 [Leptothrix cholodnii SP-6]|uniref:Uncharacterized protein n=1 Tax=Leptothrix cholodnii (strain ATCC 51168 / LMG 8142 / SP-6) TaxID=395495 RepID=B1XZH3_LEPCP|nr:hypothetical protein Lcho_4285 [Leptothrix cholodnii SP-6]